MSLFSCPECSHSISDQAYSCPFCGYPVRDMLAKARNDHIIKRERLPNGFGCIKRLSGNRKRPYAAYPTTKSSKNCEAVTRRLAIGYYRDWYEAYEALRNYKESGGRSSPSALTFANVYQNYYSEKFSSKSRTFSKSTRQAYESAFQNCEQLHNQSFSALKKADLQATIDSCELGYSSHCNIKKLFDQLYKYALENDIVEKNYSLFVAINKENDIEKGEPFSPKELSLLWAHRENEDVQMILILIYSGFRIKAFESMEINLEEEYFKGGVKTIASKDRVVPIHKLIRPFTEKLATKGNTFRAATFRKDHFYPVLQMLGIAFTDTGKKHTPHDCRHTFSWLCDHFHVDDLAKHLLMGHSLGKDVEKNVYGHRTFSELKNEMAKIRLLEASQSNILQK